MISTLRVHFLALTLIASAASFTGGTAAAQTVRRPDVSGPTRDYQTQPPASSNPRGAVTGFGDTQGGVRHPSFIVEAVNFHAVDESGPNDPGDDEVFATFEAADNTMITSLVEDVDTGDREQFAAEQSCIWPAQDTDGIRNGAWSCAPAGKAGPVRFTIGLYELDPDYVGELDALFTGQFSLCLPGSDDVRAASSCVKDHSDLLFRNEFSYEVSEILARLDPSCRCLSETVAYRQTDWRGDSDYQVTFRITRVDAGGEPLGADRNQGAFDPVVHRTGTLAALSMQGFDFDGGVIATPGADLVFSSALGISRLLPSNGAKVWLGGATPRGYAACYAERASANYATGSFNVPAAGQHACYITSDGRVGELRIDSLSGGGNATLSVSYTTWQ